MRTLLSVFAAVVFLTSAAQAEFLFDNFDTGRGLSNGATLVQPALGSSAMDAVAGGTRTATITGAGTDWREGNFNNAPGPAFLNLTPNQQSIRNNIGPGTLTLDYALASVFDFTNIGQQFLQFHMFENVTPGGTWTYDVTIASGASTATVSGTVEGGTPPAGVLTLEDDDFGAAGLAISTMIDRISITLSGPNGGQLNRTDSGLGARIVAVPEPSAIALLGLTGIGGVMVARRRRKSQKAAESV